MDRAGGAEHRRALVAGLQGRVIEIGAGNARMFAHYPPEVTEVLAIEPEPRLRAAAIIAAHSAPVPIRVIDGLAEALPGGNNEFDSAVTALVLCSVKDQAAVLAEIHRVLRDGGQLRFFEHVAAEHSGPMRTTQCLVDATVWPRLFAGCHTGRDTATAITTAEFSITDLHRFRFPATGPRQPRRPPHPRNRHPTDRRDQPVNAPGNRAHAPITLHTRPGCRYCFRQRLRRLTFTEINIWPQPQAAAARPHDRRRQRDCPHRPRRRTIAAQPADRAHRPARTAQGLRTGCGQQSRDRIRRSRIPSLMR